MFWSVLYLLMSTGEHLHLQGQLSQLLDSYCTMTNPGTALSATEQLLTSNQEQSRELPNSSYLTLGTARELPNYRTALT